MAGRQDGCSADVSVLQEAALISLRYQLRLPLVAVSGKSSCVSSHALHNEILRRRPDLHKVGHLL